MLVFGVVRNLFFHPFKYIIFKREAKRSLTAIITNSEDKIEKILVSFSINFFMDTSIPDRSFCVGFVDYFECTKDREHVNWMTSFFAGNDSFKSYMSSKMSVKYTKML